MALVIGGVAINISHKLQQPQKPYKNRFRLIGLRGKLLLATIALFILPIAGLSYLKELELFLKNNHAESTLVNAKTIASVFRNNASLVRLNRLTESSSPAIYCHSLQNKKIIDGFAGDWFTLQNRQQYFYPIQQTNTEDALAHKLSLLCVNDDQYYYFLLSVDKSSLEENKSFGQIGFIASKATDMIRFDFLNYARQIQSYEFKLQTPGWVKAQAITPVQKNSLSPQITAQWQANNQGFSLEFKVPINGINSQLAFQFQQLTPQNIIKPLISSAHSSTINSFSTIQILNPIVTNDRLNTLKLQHLTPPNTRLWLLNKQHYINAKSTSEMLKKDRTNKDNKKITESESNNTFSLLALYRRLYLIVMNYPQQQSIYGRNQAKIDNPFVQLNLQGKSSTDWLDNPHSDKMLLSVTTPVYDYDNRVIGSLVLEQNNDTLLALQDQTFERILYLTLLVFFTITLTLFFISSRLLKRIINLRNDTNLALSNDGHISNQLYRNDNDEIGDLARSFSTLLSRIEQNNEYLRSLSSKLSHELRTPLTIIKSSLENMDRQSLNTDNSKYTVRGLLKVS
ncbi:histidine kinase dimerization/phospho-acceptor domain-containing protein [sulfur-oxidizing endosymbiont of Gigantopelta aegis]|uniref:histidine kinase dimerization/phospho-acceptor domain-containing protein n=1 Tax=sulfur-oxidizing endosymbiont of Gigantopelta aegis TaxID=2794934 RepID=UPI0018DE3EDE|nr:histidine kinase dimerization/phospho-acceptor domain-containing protein [sulfur-oxidizing endosymbiont of Gigantopelta aegis]